MDYNEVKKIKLRSMRFCYNPKCRYHDLTDTRFINGVDDFKVIENHKVITITRHKYLNLEKQKVFFFCGVCTTAIQLAQYGEINEK